MQEPRRERQYWQTGSFFVLCSLIEYSAMACQSETDVPATSEQTRDLEGIVPQPKPLAKTSKVEAEKKRSARPDPIFHVQIANESGSGVSRSNSSGFVRRNEPVEFGLALPGARSWSEANLGRFIVRLADGSQHSIPRPNVQDRAASFYRPQVAGPAMFVISAGVSDALDGRGQESMEGNTHFAKHIVQIGLQDSAARVEDLNFGISDRVGQLLELRPLMHIFGVPLRSLLPIKVYDHGKSRAGAIVEVFKPDGSREELRSNQAGIVNYRPDQYGPWLFRYRSRVRDQQYVAELSFTTTETGLKR